jgi:tripartite-type tricarboxylate transporter receptor subunit TctC
MLVPAGTPAAIMATLNEAVVKALRAKDVNDRLSGEAAVPVGSTPEQFAKHLETEISKWASVVKQAGVRAENY